MPTALRVHLAHACVQAIADAVGADVLHIKGPAVNAALLGVQTITEADGTQITRRMPRLSTDADVLVRPSHVASFLRALHEHEWVTVTRFETGSAFEHAASLWHDRLGYVDVHRRFPGITIHPEDAFDRLWQRRHSTPIAHYPCQLPAVADQRLILLLHAARSGGLVHHDTDVAWTRASAEEREQTLALASEFGADVALAAATGRLDDFADDPTTPLWRLFVDGVPGRLDEWRARIRATPGLGGRLRLVARSLLVNTDHLGMALGRPPRPTEVVVEYGRRVGRLTGELVRLAVRSRRGDR